MRAVQKNAATSIPPKKLPLLDRIGMDRQFVEAAKRASDPAMLPALFDLLPNDDGLECSVSDAMTSIVERNVDHRSIRDFAALLSMQFDDPEKRPYAIWSFSLLCSRNKRQFSEHTPKLVALLDPLQEEGDIFGLGEVVLSLGNIGDGRALLALTQLSFSEAVQQNRFLQLAVKNAIHSMQLR